MKRIIRHIWYSGKLGKVTIFAGLSEKTGIPVSVPENRVLHAEMRYRRALLPLAPFRRWAQKNRTPKKMETMVKT